ncbi:hypothetical protein BDW67DRAFT_167284 [Aspergillus spinulosporus]
MRQLTIFPFLRICFFALCRAPARTERPQPSSHRTITQLLQYIARRSGETTTMVAAATVTGCPYLYLYLSIPRHPRYSSRVHAQSAHLARH